MRDDKELNQSNKNGQTGKLEFDFVSHFPRAQTNTNR